MKTFFVYAHHEPERKRIEDIIKSEGFVLDNKKPDFVITYGGDGTILDAERDYPGTPKIPLRRSIICSRCESYTIDELKGVLQKISQGRHKIVEYSKVEGEVRGKKLTGLNEVQIHNKNPSKALRFMVFVSGRPLELKGDGVIVATPYGSTAYYHSLGYEQFDSGIRAGFNNTIPRTDSFEVKDTLEVKILREEGLFLADNNRGMVELDSGDVVKIRESKDKARFVKV